MTQKLRSLLFIIPFIFASCEKKFLEIIPVIQLEDDISIPNGGNIKYFSFPSISTGYAASDTTFIHKTIDGGKNWSKIIIQGSSGKCAGIEFFNDMHGMVLMGTSVYVTSNGGQNWTIKQNGNFIGIADGQKGIIGRWDVAPPLTPGPENFCSIFVSNDNGSTFQSFGKITIEKDFLSGKVTGTKVFAVGKDVYYTDVINGIDLSNSREIHQYMKLTYDEKPKDIFQNAQTGAVVGNKGIIYSVLTNNRTYYRHNYTFNSIDGYGDFMIAVGEKTIASNLDLQDGENWNEVFDKNGNSFQHTFFKIKFYNQEKFYLSGNNGLLWKAKI